MKNLKKYHATEKVSYNRGVLYEVDRISDAETLIGKKKNSESFLRRTVKKVMAFFGALSDKLTGLFRGGKKRYIKKSSGRQVKRYRRATQADKKFYILTSAAAAAIVLVTAISTSVALAKSTVVINDEGRISYATVEEGQTVTELLLANDISINRGDAVEVSEEQTLSDGMQIVIHRAMPVTVYADGEKQSVSLLAGTVQDVINEAGITIGEADEVYPDLITQVTNGMTVSVIRVQTEEVTETSEIEYKEIRKQSDKYLKGQEVLAQEGKNGVLERQIRIVYKDGVEFSREVIGSTVVREAQDEIVYVGTYVAPQPTKKPNTGGSTGGSSGGSSGGNTGGGSSSTDYGQNIPAVDGLLTKLPTISQLHSGTLSQHKSVAAPSPDLIAQTVTCEVTAYTWTGHKTATGVYPRIGTLAVNPKLIPYGTLVYIPGYGYGRAEDTGGHSADVSGYWIDLYMNSNSECISWGRRNIKVYILKG